MVPQKANLMQMARAPFLSSIISPLVAGTLLAITINNSVNILGFLFVLIMGIGLHVATNVYNDIYDTIQGTDKINVHRNEFSGGSGVLLDHPEMMPKMYNLARAGLIMALIGTVALMFVVDKSLWILLWGLYFMSAFFSKFYTAAPIKVAYRGFGEISVWFAFGPMAILVAAVSQNVGFHPVILIATPATGISTLSILLLGQLIDLDADKATGKWGVAARLGTKAASYIYLVVQVTLMIDIIALSQLLNSRGWVILICLIPYILLLPQIWKIMIKNHDNPMALKTAAKINVQLHLLFSILLSLGIGIYLIVR
ncbi:prenyltransferase [candidate division KSB1 bacterium]|nr:prenyltransferase [candidate division KSB1 bacterium]